MKFPKSIHTRVALNVGFLFFCFPAFAQRPPDIPLSPEINRKVVENAIKVINRYYVSADIAKRLEEGLKAKLRSGAYDRIASAFDLIDALDNDMYAISKDAHLKLAYGHRPQPMPIEGKEFAAETKAEKEEGRKAAAERKFGFEKVETLPGNIGYLEMNSFIRPEFSGEAAGKAFDFLSDTEALIIDLRRSSGGSADMVVFLASYFFDEEPFRLGDWFTRAENSVQQWWTYPYVPGGRYLDRDVYILVSKRSFSAVEGLASILQHHKRAIIVGEKTSGGTHPGSLVRVHPNFALFVPMSWFIYPTGTPAHPIGRPVFPTSKTDYQGTGVTPDIAVPAAQALKAAHINAMERRLEKDPAKREALEPLIRKLKAEPQAKDR